MRGSHTLHTMIATVCVVHVRFHRSTASAPNFTSRVGFFADIGSVYSRTWVLNDNTRGVSRLASCRSAMRVPVPVPACQWQCQCRHASGSACTPPWRRGRRAGPRGNYYSSRNGYSAAAMDVKRPRQKSRSVGNCHTQNRGSKSRLSRGRLAPWPPLSEWAGTVGGWVATSECLLARIH